MLPPTVVRFCSILQIIKPLQYILYLAPLPCPREDDDADDEIQQNMVSFTLLAPSPTSYLVTSP